MAKLPFRMMPGSWGLRGKTRAVAEAEYLYEGDELTAKLAEIEADGDPVQSELNVLAAQLKAGELTHPEYEKECANAKGEPFVNVLDVVGRCVYKFGTGVRTGGRLRVPCLGVGMYKLRARGVCFGCSLVVALFGTRSALTSVGVSSSISPSL